MSHRDAVVQPPTGAVVNRRHRRLAGGGIRASGPRACSACSSTPRWRTRPTASACWRTSCTRPAVPPPPGRRTASSRPPSPPSGRRWGNGRAVCGLSGGVDSAVAAALVRQAIGANLTCVFVDTGLMRAGETDQVREGVRRRRPRPRGRRRQVPGRAGGRRRPGGEAAHHRRAVRARLRGRGRGRWATWPTWCRARSTPT